MIVTKDIKMVVPTTDKERQPITAVWRNGGFSASYDSFVVGSSAVLRLNFCAKNPPLRQAAKRYRIWLKDNFSLLQGGTVDTERQSGLSTDRIYLDDEVVTSNFFLQLYISFIKSFK